MAEYYRSVTVMAGLNAKNADIYDIAADADRAIKLLELGKQQGYNTQQVYPETGRVEVYVTGCAQELLGLLAPIIQSGTAPYYAIVETMLQSPLFEDDAEIQRFVDGLWERYGDKVIHELEVE